MIKRLLKIQFTQIAHSLPKYQCSNYNLESVESVLNEHIKDPQALSEVKRVLYGKPETVIQINPKAQQIADENNFEIKSFKIDALKEQLRSPRIGNKNNLYNLLVRIAAIQNQIVKPTNSSVIEQRDALLDRIGTILEAAHHQGANVVGLQECFNAPFFFCTREIHPWIEFAESAENGVSTNYLKKLAKKYDMVIISSILERDDVKGSIHNTAVIIDNEGDYLGKHRKFHIPRVGDFNESTYYMEGDNEQQVFQTQFGKIGVNICYGRHHPLHWQTLALNGAEVVYNPSATVGGLSEPLWGIEARNAAIANHMFTVGINRVGTEHYYNEFTSGDGKKAKNDFGHFYGSSYVAAPDGQRTPGLSRVKDGLLVTEVDLNMCQQIKDKWKMHMTARYPFYADFLAKYVKHDFKPDIVKKGK